MKNKVNTSELGPSLQEEGEEVLVQASRSVPLTVTDSFTSEVTLSNAANSYNNSTVLTGQSNFKKKKKKVKLKVEDSTENNSLQAGAESEQQKPKFTASVALAVTTFMILGVGAQFAGQAVFKVAKVYVPTEDLGDGLEGLESESAPIKTNFRSWPVFAVVGVLSEAFMLPLFFVIELFTDLWKRCCVKWGRRGWRRRREREALLAEEGEEEAEPAEPPFRFRIGMLGFCLSGLAESMAVSLCTICLVAVEAPISQMFRGSRAFFVGLFTLLFCCKCLQGSQLLGIGLSFFGVLTVALGFLLLPPAWKKEEALLENPKINIDNSDDHIHIANRERIVNIILCLVGNMMGAAQFLAQTEVYKRWGKGTPSLVAVGIEGCTSLVVQGFALAVGPEEWRKLFKVGVKEVYHSFDLKLSMFAYFFCIGILCATGSTLGRQFSAGGRAVLECTRSVAVWLMEFPWIALVLYHGKDGPTRSKAIQVRKLNAWEGSFWTEKVGFVLVVFGTLLYFQILKMGKCGDRVPCASASKGSTRAAPKEEEEEKDVEDGGNSGELEEDKKPLLVAFKAKPEAGSGADN